MNKEQAKQEVQKYKSFLNNRFKNRANGKVYIVEDIEENIITDTDKYQVLISFRSEIKEPLNRTLVENVDVFLRIYDRA